jgi:hypothetical protein
MSNKTLNFYHIKQALYVIIAFGFLLSCNSQKSETENISNTKEEVIQTDKRDENKLEKQTNISKFKKNDFKSENIENVLTPIKESIETLPQNINQFVTDGFEVLDTASGDINLDGILDLLIILKDKDEHKKGDEKRPLLLLIRNKENKLSLSYRNDNVVYDISSGGVFGDPYEGITIKNGYFSIEHYGGSNWRWTKIITFKYSKSDNNWYLHRDGGESYHTSKPEKAETKVKTTKDFGKVTFEDYNIYEE